jgi:hypothetical protein
MTTYCTDLVRFTKGGCHGHSAKFDNCLIEGLYEVARDGVTAVEEFGDSVNWEGFFWVFMLRNSITASLPGHGDAVVLIPPGGYLLREHTDGRVTLAAEGDYPAVTREADMWARKWEHEH